MLLQRTVRSRAEADDLFQKTFRIAIEKIRAGDVRQPERISGFICSLANNLLTDHFRRGARRKVEAIDASVTASTEPGPLDKILREENAKIVRKILDELPLERDRQVLRRFYIAEENKASISAGLGLSSLQFDQILFRARPRYEILYLADELSAEEKTAFEEHFFDCQECLEELEMASFRQGMKDGATVTTAPARWWMLLAFAAGVIVALALVALLKRTPDFPEQQQLAAERQKNAELQRELALAATPQTNIDIYPLNVARESGAVSQLRLPATRRTFVLMLDRQPDPSCRSYRAKLSDAADRVIWTREGIEPGARATFAIALPSDLFGAGDYFLDFGGDSGSGFVRMARYRLHVTSSAEK